MSREDWEVFDEMKRERKEAAAARRAAWAARLDKLGEHRWTKCHDTHYQCTLLGDTLDYWPGTQKWRWRGKTRTGDVLRFIEKQLS